MTDPAAVDLALELGLYQAASLARQGIESAPIRAIRAALDAARAEERERLRCPWHPEMPGETTPCCVAAAIRGRG